LAPSVGAPPGAVVLRSDEVRKRICGKAPLERLGPEGYTSEVSQRVYAALAAQARATVHAGAAAIVDAVFARPADRKVIERMAVDAGVPFHGFWLEVSEPILLDRLRDRVADASDADASVLRLQQVRGVGEISWHRIDAAAAADIVVGAAASHLGTSIAAA
jgi:uncharacterized protein